MDNREKNEFYEFMDTLAKYYRREITELEADIYFSLLEEYSVKQIKWSATKHMKSISRGSFFPKANELIANLCGGNFDFTEDQIIAMARLKSTPIGIMCRIQIGTFNLNSQDWRLQKQCAQECIALMPAWADRALRGDYKNHEISIMRKHDVDPCGAVALGYPRANNPDLPNRIAQIEKSPRHAFLLAPPEDVPEEKNGVAHENVKNFLKEIANA